MRYFAKIAVAATAILSIGIQSAAQAAMVGAPMALRGAIQQIKFEGPAMTPMAFTQFCMKYADDCKPRHQPIFRGSRVKLDAERWATLNRVNRNINGAIRFERNEEGLRGEKWLINPASGDCNDYAVSKRHELMARGWSARSLLLSEVVTTWGEHHLILVVRTNSGDLVLDSIGGTIVPWSKKAYQWLRIQTPKNPTFWASLSERNA